MEKKIATSVEALIKVAQYESIRITKYGETKIEYDSVEEMSRKEDELSSQVISDLERCLRKLPERFSKAPDTIVENFGDRIDKKIPEWLKNEPEPNIANRAKESHEISDFKSDDEQSNSKETTNSTITEMEELFGSDTDSESKTDNNVEEVSVSDTETCVSEPEITEDETGEFDDDDLFS